MARKMLVLLSDRSEPILEEVLADDEAQLQERLKANPGLLPLEEFGTGGHGESS